MKKRHKVLLLVVGILLSVSIIVSISYAYYIYSVSQSGSNVVRTDCFEITYIDGNAISISDGIPLTDKEARELDLYTFTIKNICNQAVDYNVNIETLNTSTMDLDAVATKLDSKKKQILGSLENNENIVNNNASSSKTIYNNILKAGEEKTHNLRLWIDEDATIEQSMNKSFSSKVVVSGSLLPNYSEASLISGYTINGLMKTAAGQSDAWIWTENRNITEVKRSDVPPADLNAATIVSKEDSEVPVYMWFDDGIIYFYSKATKVYLNSYNEGLFQRLYNAKHIDLSMFDTSRANVMNQLFYEDNSLLDIDVSNFDTSNVTNMSGMFAYLYNLKELDVSNFDTSQVTNMSNMFLGLNILTELDVSNFDTSQVQNMSWMFNRMLNLRYLDLSNFNTSKVKNMEGMFSEMNNLTSLDVSNFDTSSVTNMERMFNEIPKLEILNVSSFDTSKVTTFEKMFSGLSVITELDLSNFNTSSAKTMEYMFGDCNKLTYLDVSSFDTSNVTNMYGMFCGLTKLVNLNLSNFNTSKVTNMGAMFCYDSMITSLDISSFDTSSLIKASRMFESMDNVQEIIVSEGWNTTNISESVNMFYKDYKLVGSSGTIYDANNLSVDYAHVDGGTSNPGYFTLKTN